MKKDDSFRKRMIEATKLNRMDEADVKKRIARLYERAAYELANEAEWAKKGSFTETFKRQLSASMRKKVHGIWRDVEDMTIAGMEKAADRAVGIHTGTLITAAEIGKHIQLAPRVKNIFASVPHEAVQNVLSGGVYGGKSPGLSRRIWNNEALQAGKIEEVIATGIAKKLSPVQLAKRLEAYINPKMAMPDDWTDVYPDMPFVMKTDYNAKRLAVTSIRHAAYQSTISAARRNPYTQFIHWELTDAHVIYDVCDGYAEHDEGYGAGNYSFDAAPLPHPWCTCLWYADGVEDLEDIAESIGQWVEEEERRFKEDFGISLDDFAQQINGAKAHFMRKGTTGIQFLDKILAKAKTIPDEEYFTEADPHQVAQRMVLNKRVIDSEVANNIVKTVNKINDEFSEIEGFRIVLTNRVPTIGKASWSGKEVALDRDTFSKMDKARELLQEVIKTGHTVNAEDPMFIVAHEFGHIIHYCITHKHYGYVGQSAEEFERLFMGIGEEIAEETKRHFKIASEKRFRAAASRELGKRAAVDRSELLAQSVAMYYHGSVRSPIADYIVSLLKEWLGKEVT